MAQMVQPQRRESPKSPTSPTFEQLLREDEGSWWSETNLEKEDHSHHHIKKSVLTKVKEKAKKIRHSLSLKKRHHEDENTTPAWGVSLDDDKDEEENAEYLGAPMYESELAPESYKATARHHPRAIPMLSDKHVLSTITSENENKNEDSLSSTNSTKPTQTHDHDKLSSTSTPQEKTTETASQNLAPAFQTETATVSEAPHSIASKIQCLALNSTTEPSQTNNNNSNTSQVATENTSLAQISPKTSSESGKNVSGGSDQRIWDKGVSVKDYLLSKLEPGEEDRVLSQAICDMVSPRARDASGDHQISVVDMVREAVTSLLRNNEHGRPRPSEPVVLTSGIPVSTNARKVVEEEDHGRILQTN